MKKYFYLILGTVITPISLYMAYLSGDFGHGDYLVAKILFPVAMGIAILGGRISMLAISVAALQFPFYGYLLDRKNKIFALIAALLHILLLIIVLRVKSAF